jgi:hypothetical protein
MASACPAALRLFALAIVVAGCAHAAAPAPVPHEPIIRQIDLAGPRCCEGGPTVEILRAVRHRCGKGDTCTVVDLRVRNPEDRALFLLDGRTPRFAGYLESVSLIHKWGKPSPPVWEFAGQNQHLAFKLPPGADVVIRNLDFTEPLDEFVAVFLDRIVLNYDRYIDATDPEGLLPPRGEVDMDGMTGFITDYDSERLFPLDGKEHVALGIWCTQKLPVPGELRPPTRPGDAGP